MKNFTKYDDEFICAVCGNKVSKLNYTSRDHCNKCLCSIHVDINPGDRANTCMGILVPQEIEMKKKGMTILYKCLDCGQTHYNVVANDDNYDMILALSNKTYIHILREISINPKIK